MSEYLKFLNPTEGIIIFLWKILEGSEKAERWCVKCIELDDK